MNTMNISFPAHASGLLVLASLCWGGNIVLGRAVAVDVPPIGLSFWRWTTVACILMLYNHKRLSAQFLIVCQEWRLVATLSLTGMAIFHSLQYSALNSTTAINVALIVAVSPLLVPLLARLLLKTPISSYEMLGIFLSFLGLVFIVTRGRPGTLAELDFRSGDLLMLVGACSWTVYTVVLKRKPDSLSSLTLLTWASALAALCLLPLYLWESTIGGRAIELSMTTVLSIAYTAVFASLAGFIFFNTGVAILGPAKSAVYAHLIPVFASILAVLFLDEHFHTYHVLGIIAIGSGILVTTRATPTKTNVQT